MKRSEDRWGSLGRTVDRLVSRTLRAVSRPPADPADPGTREPSAGTAAPAPGRRFDPAAARDLDDDRVKLVGYSIVSLMPGHERNLKGGSQVVTTRTTGEAFALWMIADWVKKPENRAQLLPGEEKYLRLDYGVRRRWPRQDLRFEENQLEALEAIYRALAGAGGDVGVDDGAAGVPGSGRDPNER